MASALVAFSSYSSSEIVNGVTTNAAGNGLQWVMTNILPDQLGLVVNGVIYRYTTVKIPEDQMTVDVQNENALGTGYIFRERDDWSNLPGNTITKTVPVGSIPIEYWGNGEIKVEGTGSVVDPQVAYSYRYDTCADPINDPSCPGYDAAMADFLDRYGLLYQNIDLKDPLDDENVKNALDNKTEVKEQEEDKEKSEKEKKDKEKEKKRREIALSAAESALSSSLEISQAAMLEAMNSVPSFQSYYVASMQGGMYPDTNMYQITTVPENKKGLRLGLAQQLMHDKMTNQQYRR